MWTKRPSLFMMVRIRAGGKGRFLIPIPLFVLGQALEAASDLVWLAKAIRPGWFADLAGCSDGLAGKAVSPSQALEALRHFLGELRGYGRWRMVEVETEKAEIHIDFF